MTTVLPVVLLVFAPKLALGQVCEIWLEVPFDCSEEAPGEARVLRGVLAELERRCVSASKGYDAGMEQEWAQALKRAEEAMRPPVLRHDVCTGVWEVLARIAASPPGSTHVLFTDGKETCVKRVPVMPGVLTDHLVVLVWIPPKRKAAGGSLSDEYEEARRALTNAAPWLFFTTGWSLKSGIGVTPAEPAPGDTEPTLRPPCE